MEKPNINEEVIEGVKLMFNNLLIPSEKGNLAIERELG